MITLAQIQRHVGVDADGRWGPRTLEAVARALGLGANATLATVQRRVGTHGDGMWGPRTCAAIAARLGLSTPFDRAAFLARYRNTHAPALDRADITAAAAQLSVSVGHVNMVLAVESGGRSFDATGRPVILFEPHVFHRRTDGAFSASTFSYAKWKTLPYPGNADGRWQQMANAAACDEQAALESASWGLFQIMGFHWELLGYASVQAFAAAMTWGERDQLDAMVRFILKNGLQPALAACKPGNASSCRAFAKGYNGKGYEANAYHTKLAKALK